jgi:phosphoribosylamine-glycine ligase
MNVLLIGGGGREHALAWKLSESPLVDPLYAAPGNPGIARHGRCVDIDVDDAARLLDFAARERIDLTVVGPEAPLVAGLADRFADRGLHAGPALRDGNLVTAGGRVLGVTAVGADLGTAIARADAAVKQIHFEGMQYRTDIGRAKEYARGTVRG